MAILRLSRGVFPVERLAQLRDILDFSAQPVGKAIQSLPGCLGYWSARDEVQHLMLNASVWTDITAAEQMGSLHEMQVLRAQFTSAGIKFDPITNSEILWSRD